MLNPGDAAPLFALADQSGATVSLSDFKGRKVMVFFYPRANTGGCTTQACGMRDIAGDVGTAAIIGISPDNTADQASFDKNFDLGFPLLADDDHAVAEAYDVWRHKGLKMGVVRSAFLIDEVGLIEEAWYQVAAADTPRHFLAALAR
jgi:peroxiredoxin Q/BCP